MTLQEQLRDTEAELVRLERYSEFLKDRAARLKQHLALYPTGDSPLIQWIAEHLAESGEFQAVAIDRTIAQIRQQVKAATSSVIIPAVKGMQ